MSSRKRGKKSEPEEQARIRKEMAEPRRALSARIAERNMDSSRVRQMPSTSLAGIVNRIFLPQSSNKVENANIAISGPGSRRQDLRIENALIDENGDTVRLKKGFRVDITISSLTKRVKRDE